MEKGRGGLGVHKHRTSGVAPHSPRFRVQRIIDLKRAELEKQKKPKPKMFGSVKEALNRKEKI